MSDNDVTRVHYFERQFLRTEDFVDEQAYHIAMRRRHNIAHHVWGIVQGLELVFDEKEGDFFVRPGMAVDGYGRELIWLQQKPVCSTDIFDHRDGDVLDVWLIYERVGAEKAQKGYVDCGSKDNTPHIRSQEYAVIHLKKPNLANSNRRAPESVPVQDNDFKPYRHPPDNPMDDWPVFLGQIIRERTDPSQSYSYRVNLTDRPYAGLIGERIASPTEEAEIRVGAVSKDKDSHQFAVCTVKDNGDLTSRLEISRNGEIKIHNQTTLTGDLTIKNGAVELLDVGSANSAQPWCIYRFDKHQMRIEIPSGGEGKNQVVIGAWSHDKKSFSPCLTIYDNCTVKVHGNLIVEGQLIESQQARTSAPLDPSARNFSMAAMMTGMAGATNLLERFYQGSSKNIDQIAAELLDSERGRQAVVNSLAETQKQREAFVKQLLGNATCTDTVIINLVGTASGVDNIVAALERDEAVLGQFAGTLLREKASQTILVAKLFNTETGIGVIVAALEGSPSLRNNFADQFIGSPNCRITIVAALFRSDLGRTALISGLNDAADPSDFTDQLVNDPTARPTVTRSLLKFEEGRQTIVDSLPDNPAQLGDFVDRLIVNESTRDAATGSLLQNDNGRTAVADSLLASLEGRQTLVTSLETHPTEREAFANALTANETIRDAVTTNLLQESDGRIAVADGLLASSEGQQALVTSLETHPAEREAFANALTANETTRGAVTSSLLEDDAGRAGVADGLLDDEEGRRALAESLKRNTERLQASIEFIKEEYPEVLAALCEAAPQ